MLASHYLAIRLPAETTLPHRDYPRPTIFTLSSSYSHRDVAFPGGSTVSSPVPPDARDHEEHQQAPRPRPLFVDKRLPSLAKEDPLAHKMFIEGVALLAYNVAWACCSQGVPIGEKTSFDDVCNIGRNLFGLLIGSQLHSNPGRILAASPSPTSANPPDGELGEIGKATNLMGRYSHGTAHTFLGDDVTRAFKLPNPKSLTDRLKSRLSSEGPAADWEMLEDDAWAMDDALDEEILAKGHKRNTSDQTSFGVESLATVRAALDETMAERRLSPAAGAPVVEDAKSSGTSGWTKLKSR